MSGILNGWRISAGDEHHIFDGDSRTLARVPCGGMSGRTFAEGEKCARLIAAAPCLLEALQAIMNERWSPAGRSEHVSDLARAAIAKATGEAGQ